ncbi:MAG: hypothetical protein ACN6O0_19345 [Achromobacter spanius]
MAPVDVPLYKDLAFWSLLVAILAIIISVAPYVWRLLRPLQLRMEIGDQAHTMHFPAGSVLGVFLSLSNTGPRPLRVSSVVATLIRDGGPTIVAPCAALFPKHDVPFAVAFLPVFLKPEETWGGFFVNFAKRKRDDQKRTRQLYETLNSHPDNVENSAYDSIRSKTIRDLKAVYGETLTWAAGNYTVEFAAHVDGHATPFKLKFSFFLHESEVEEIKRHADDIGINREAMPSWPTSPMKVEN